LAVFAGIIAISNKHFKWIVASIVLLSFAFLSAGGEPLRFLASGYGDVGNGFFDLLRIPMIRALCFSGIGVLFSGIRFDIKQKWAATLLQLVAFGFVIKSLLFGFNAGNYPALTMAFSAATVVALILFSENTDVVSRAMNTIGKNATIVSRYALFVYVFIINAMHITHIATRNSAINGLESLGIAIIFAVIYYHAEQFVRRKLAQK